jgi:hypothetical protein
MMTAFVGSYFSSICIILLRARLSVRCSHITRKNVSPELDESSLRSCTAFSSLQLQLAELILHFYMFFILNIFHAFLCNGKSFSNIQIAGIKHYRHTDAVFFRTILVIAGPRGRAVYDRSVAGVVGSNPAGGMGVCPLGVLCCVW